MFFFPFFLRKKPGSTGQISVESTEGSHRIRNRVRVEESLKDVDMYLCRKQYNSVKKH